MRKIFHLLTAALVCLVLLQGRALAQYENGSIVGTVHDGSGAVVPDATVKVTNIATGVVSTRQTNETGDYEVPALRVGQYNVEVSKTGFAPGRATDITVSIGARQRIDLTLQIGETSTTVEVSGVSLQVDTDTSQRGQIVTQYQTAALPLVSRNYSDLIGLTTGVRQTTQSYSSTSNTGLVREGSFNVNGQRSIFNNFLLDGMDNNAYGESNQGFSNQIIQPAPDSIAQFQVVTNNETAEYGRASGAVVNVAFAQGGNKFHGRVYEFLRNTDLNATGFFRPPGGKKPSYNRNQFGGNVNGPIIRDHLFFFLDYEGFRQVRKQISSATVPTVNQASGIFSKTVYDPYTGTPYAAGTSILNAPDISPSARTVAGLIAGLGQSNATNSNFTTFQRSNNYTDKGDLRLDYTINSRNSVFVRASHLKTNATDFPIFGLPLDGSSNGKQRILDQQIAGGYTRVIGANQLLDARFGFSRTRAGKYSLSIGTNPGFAFPGLPTDPTVAGGIPSISITGFSALGRQSTNPQFQNPSLLNPKVNYTWVVKNHSLKAGYEYQQVWMDVQDTNPLYGGFTFAGGFSRNYVGGKTSETSTSDNTFADFLWGATNQYNLSSYFVAQLRNRSHFAYLQDDWKVTPKLTINMGMRYEYTTPYWEEHNRQSNFDPSLAASNPLGAMVPVTSTGNKYGYSPDRDDWAPRFGFSYAADDKTVIRGGYGVSFSHYDRAGSGNILAINPPEALFVTVAQTAPNAGGSAANYVKMDQGFPSSTLQFNPITANVTYIDSNRYRDSYVHNYYLDVQRSLAKNILFDVAYVGNHGLKLLQLANLNQKDPAKGYARPIPTYGDITIALHSAYSHYDALQVRYEQRMVRGLTLLNSFSWSHALDNAGASLEANTPSPQDIRNLAADYGQSEYNQPIINTTSLVYELPFGYGRHWLNRGGIVNQVLGQWQVSAVNQAMSGFPYQITYNPPSAFQVSGISASYRGSNLYRPNRVPGRPLNKLDKSSSTGTSIQYINRDAIQIPTSVPGATSPFGNMARDPGRSPTFNSLNIAFNKRFDTPLESLKVEFRGEMYNAFNHTNFTQPGGSIAVSSTGLTGGTITNTFDPRIVQFGLKALF
ncbi:TonB-dependent receptor [Edaphobacter sp. 12200R-103]|uniref:TonB-dependent receptor n=1 Tax=Edaphobacter sp. 12200R-103 TaxID=2703788 RepID=UPI00138D589A|nr:TonB-dependent receptor [Edaphobacter sp. 12200R-103]QHS52610.1 TonB-dependent receptor [Edaphobacter sp. 12200R-103]